MQAEEGMVWASVTGVQAGGGAIWMLASSQFLLALALSPTLASPVARVRVTPLSSTLVAAFTVVTPGMPELRVTEQLPVSSTISQQHAPRPQCPLTILYRLLLQTIALT